MKTPYIGFSNETLDKMPTVKAGDIIECQKCGGDHVLMAADDGSELLLFYRCSGGLYLGAVAGKMMMHIKPDVSGEM